MGIKVALDGPSGAGKSTIAKAVAAKLGFIYVDTGALYRSVAYNAICKGADVSEQAQAVKTLEGLDIKLIHRNGVQTVLVNGEDVGDKIRTPEVSMATSAISKLPEVRDFLLETQRSIAESNDIIMDGRDIGTVVLPDAQVKVYLTASAEERARRRFKELNEKGDPSTYEEVLEDINKRDYNDTHRDIAPLRQADDAVLVDSTDMDIEQAAETIVKLVEEYRAGKGDEKKNPGSTPAETDKASELSFKSAEKKSRRQAIMPLKPVTKTKRINPLRQGFYNFARPIVRFIFNRWFDLSYEGLENVPKDGGNIFASNHRSYGDPIFIALMTRVPISYMAKEELFKQNIFFTLLIKAWGAFPVVRGTGDTAIIDTSIEKLESGRNLVIFPEGTRSKDGRVGKGKTGVALIAAVAQTPVIPVGINFEGEKLERKKKIVVRYGKPIIPQELGIDSADTKNLKKMKKEIMDSITDLVR